MSSKMCPQKDTIIITIVLSIVKTTYFNVMKIQRILSLNISNRFPMFTKKQNNN